LGNSKIEVGIFAYFLYNIPNFSGKYLFVLGGNMKQTIMFVGVFLISTCGFAGLTKGSPQLNALGAAWKAHPSTQAQLNHNDIMMGYAGVDISRKPTIVTQTASL
jgi:hypothetical protein